MKKVLAFDIDDTLVVSKQPLTDRMAETLVWALDAFEVCIISGGKFEIFQENIIGRLPASHEQLSHLHLMPTCGTRYYRYDTVKQEWVQRYAEDLEADEKQQIIDAAEKAAKELDMWPTDPYGEVIEDRNSQISISMLGQLAPADVKKEWADKYEAKREVLRRAINDLIPNYEVRSGGMTTIDITRIGIDKAYGIEKLIQELELAKDDVLFFGDKLQEGGNDYPVKASGVDSLEVSRWEDTALAVESILHAIK